MAEVSPLRFFLAPQPQETIFTGRVNGAPSDPYINITFDNGSTGAFGNPLAGMTVYFGTTAGGSERGKRRLRSFSGASTGTIKIDESDDVGPIIQNNDYITIRSDIRLWGRYPRFVQSGENVTIYEDYDIAYNNQTSNWWPVAVTGPPGFALLEGGTAQISFVGDRSSAMAQGATITNYLWTAYNSNEGTSASQGTEGAPVVFTWTAPGWYLVSLKVTDSNGNTHTSYTWAIIENPDNPSITHEKFYNTSDTFDFEQGGGECSFVVQDASPSDFPEECMVVHIADGTQTTPTASWPFRTNILFVGWVLTDSIRQNPESGDVSFRAGTVDAIMRNVSMFPVSLTDVTTPVEWTQAKNLTVDRAASYLYKWHSVLDTMTPIVFSGDTRLIKRQDFGPTDLYSTSQGELVSSILGKVVCTPQGVIYITIDYNVMNSTERAAVDTGKTLHKGIWVNDVGIEERADYQWPSRKVSMSGIAYFGGEYDDICPLFSEAPGDAMKSYGKENNFDRLILSSQSDLNVRCGHMLAKLTQRFYSYRMSFINDGSFSNAPQVLFPAIIEDEDNERGYSYSGNLIPRRMTRAYNYEAGYYQIEVEFEPETSGQPGLTVDVDCGPPEQVLPVNPPSPQNSTGGPESLILSTTGTSFYFQENLGDNWERRVNGLAANQLSINDTIADPWSTFKQGYNPNGVIVWACGQGFLARSKDTGKNWADRTSFLSSPSVDVPLANVSFKSMTASIFTENQMFMLANWQLSGTYQAAFGKTTDGFDFEWTDISGDNVIGLGLSLDKGNGQTLWLTHYGGDSATGTIYLKNINPNDSSVRASYSLGQVGLSEIDPNNYYATPFNRVGFASEIFVFGKMNEPQGLSGTVHVLMNDSSGTTGSYSVIERGFDGTCGSFIADEDGYYYAVENGVAT